MLDLVFKNNTSQKILSEKFFKKILVTGIKELKIQDKNVELSLNLVGEAKIKELNKKYRSKNVTTNVLSFSLKEPRLKKYGILPLGDIFICLPFAVKEAERQNISLEKELAWLTVHGLLHLLGYDHPDDEVSGPRLKRRGEKMFQLENKILNKIK